MWREEMTNDVGRPKKPADNEQEVNSDIITNNPERGTAKSYTVSRLKRESPELFAQVVAGDLSANAASHRSKCNANIVTSVTVQNGEDAGGIKAGAIDIGLWA